MRIRVRFVCDEQIRVPINSNYFLSSAIYNTLSVRPDYAKFLHDTGYTHEPSGRMFKLFVFSPLMCRNRRVFGDDLLLGPGEVGWIISSPMSEFVIALAEGLLSRGEIDVRGTHLHIESIEAMPEPQYCEEMKFSCLSPIVISRPGDDGDYAYFCKNTDPDFSDRVRANLIRKHELIYGRQPQDTRFEMTFDPDYISRKQGRITKLIDIRGIRIRGVYAPFVTSGSPDLIILGHDVGYGEKGSMGFGCVQATMRTI